MRSSATRPRSISSSRTEADWKGLAPAIDPHYYPVEILFHLFQEPAQPRRADHGLRSTARNISVQGEAPIAALAYQLAEKVKKQSRAPRFHFRSRRRRAFSLTVTRNSAWRENRNDWPLARADESTRARPRARRRRGLLFLLLNLVIWSALLGMSADLRGEIARRKKRPGPSRKFISRKRRCGSGGRIG